MAEVSIFLIHYKVSDLVDSVVKSALPSHMLHTVILLPIIAFLFIQLVSYALFIAWIWFITVSIVELFPALRKGREILGVIFFLLGCSAIISFNNYYFSASFF